jgi:hypothetical protein
MGKINFGRVVIAGLLAGFLMNIFEYVLNGIILKTQMETFFSEHKFTDPGGIFIAIAVVLTFVLGIFLVLLYAMIRPRFGPGPKTAVIAASMMWFFVVIYCGIINSVLFAIPAGTVILVTVWCFVEYLLAGLLGALVYKEVQI